MEILRALRACAGRIRLPRRKFEALAVKLVRNGQGIVAMKPFRRGAILCEIKGKLVTGEEVWRYWETDPRLAENCFRSIYRSGRRNRTVRESFVQSECRDRQAGLQPAAESGFRHRDRRRNHARLFDAAGCGRCMDDALQLRGSELPSGGQECRQTACLYDQEIPATRDHS